MRTRKPRHYSQQTKRWALAVLARNGGNRYQTAKETGIPRTTLVDWIKEVEERGEPLPQDGAPLADQFEEVAYQLIAVMPEKLEEANLHQIIEALRFVLEKVGQTGDDKSTDAREKLIRLLDRYAEAGEAQRNTGGDDGG